MYQAIAQAIIKSIMADEYPTKLPTEKVLMAQYNASRNTILDGVLRPIRERRAIYEADPAQVLQILKDGTAKANVVADQTWREMQDAIGI
ncbi:hypothetical protein WP50_39375, partial [Lactiplantibacillus plantarum]